MSASIPELHATLRPDAVRLQAHTGEEKDISYKDFLTFLQVHTGTLQEEAGRSSTYFRLPESCIGVSFSANSIEMTLYFREAKRDLYFGSRCYKDCALPNVVIQVSMKPSRERSAADKASSGGLPSNWYVVNARWYCTDLPPGQVRIPVSHSQSNHMWILPVPNMYDNGKMCTGDNGFPDVRGLDFRVMDSLYEDILVKGRFNNDLSVRDVSFGMRNEESISLYSRCYRFPYEILRGFTGGKFSPSDIGSTVRGIRKELKEKLTSDVKEIKRQLSSMDEGTPLLPEEVDALKKQHELEIKKCREEYEKEITTLKAKLALKGSSSPAIPAPPVPPTPPAKGEKKRKA